MNPPDEFDSSTVPPVVRRPRSGRGAQRPDGDARRDAAPAPRGGDGTREGRTRRETPARGGERRRPDPGPSEDRSPRDGAPASVPGRVGAVPAGSTATAPPRGARDGRVLAGGPHDGDDGEEYVVLPAPTRGGRRLLAVGGVLVVVAGLLIGGLLIWASRQIDPPGDPGEAIAELEVASGSSVEQIGALLEDEGVITSSRLFRYYVGWKGAGPWEAGTYIDFRRSSSFDEAIEVLDRGPVPAASAVVRVVEGRRLVDAFADIAEQVDHIEVEDLEQALSSGEVVSRYRPAEAASWEGFLFPDTYQFDEDVTAVEVLQTMATKMDTVLDELDFDKAETLRGRTAYDLVTIASLIEKETGAPEEERGMISRAISNRLDDGETLGIDASVLYGLDRTAGALTQSDLDTDTPYNSRMYPGLPPTPIALPGRASLAAAMSPTEGTWKYYVLVSNDPPTHFFTDDYDEFVNAKNEAQANGVF